MIPSGTGFELSANDPTDAFEYNPGRSIKSASFYNQDILGDIPENETDHIITFGINSALFVQAPTCQLSVKISKDKFSWPVYADGFDLDEKAKLSAKGNEQFKEGETVYLSDILVDPAQAVLAIKAIN